MQMIDLGELPHVNKEERKLIKMLNTAIKDYGSTCYGLEKEI
jgi:hypothetical protein